MSKTTSNLLRRSSLTLMLFSALMGSIAFSKAKAQIPNAWINELHYDNDGTDIDEGVEIVVESASSFDISLFEITLYNGNNGEAYKITSFSPDDEGKTWEAFTVFAHFIPNIQNGAPDGIALSYNGDLLQFISYEGSLTATNGVAQTSTATAIGVEESSGTASGSSLQLSGIGNRYGTFVWDEASPHTFGDINHGQTLTAIDGPQAITGLEQTYIAPHKVQIGWTKPIGIHGEDWDGVLVLASDGTPNGIDFKDKDFSAFNSGGNVFGAGTPIGNSFIVVRKETDEHGEAVITGFEPGTPYRLVAYTYFNVEGSNNDIFSSASKEIIVTSAVSNISALGATPLSEKARLSWENTMGPLDKWWTQLLIIGSEAPITSTPQQKDYAANDTIGKGEEIAPGEYIVYAGTGKQTVVYGLENDTPYYFKVFVQYNKDGDHYWSSGTAISCKPRDNIKLWTGKAGNDLFSDAANWEPEGVPEPFHQVVLDHQYQSSPYEVVFPSGDAPVQLNALKILPTNAAPIKVKLIAEVSEAAALTLLDEAEPLVIGDSGVLINSTSGSIETLKIPNGKIRLRQEGKYVHNSATSHAGILSRITTEEGTVPGTVAFDVPGTGNYFTSLSGRTFQKLAFSSTENMTYKVIGSNPVTVQKDLSIDDNATLNLSALGATLDLMGNLTLNGSLIINEDIIFKGTGDQLLSSNKESPVILNKIEIKKPDNNVILDTDIQLVSTLKLEQGNLLTNQHKLILDYTTSSPIINTASPTARVIGNLDVTRNVGTGKVIFPNAGLTFEAGEEALGPVRVIRTTGPEAAIENEGNKSIKRVWEIQTGIPLRIPRTLKFSWDEADEGGFDMRSAKVWQESQPSGTWIPLGDFQSGTSKTVTVSTSSLTRFTVANENNVLPITLRFFSVDRKDGHAVLRWATNSETNNAGFEIEKSVDGKIFHTIGFKRGWGNSITQKVYSFKDPYFTESAYFRLKQIDFDGKSTYSPMRYLPHVTSTNPLLTIIPNPINNETAIALFSTLSSDTLDYCILYNAQGEIMYKRKSVLLEKLQQDLNLLKASWPSGLYILQLQSTFYRQNIKLLKE